MRKFTVLLVVMALMGLAAPTAASVQAPPPPPLGEIGTDEPPSASGLLDPVTGMAADTPAGPTLSNVDPECGVDLPLDIDLAPPPPVAALSACPGIRPGAYHSIEGAGCTFNFVFRGTRKGANGNMIDEGLFIGTAGHCVFDEASADRVYAPGQGRVVTDGQRKRVGEVAYGVDEGPLDFALIRVDRAREADVNPAVCHFGGPIAMGGSLVRGDRLHHFGNGLVFGDSIPGRTGLADNYSNDGAVLNWHGAAGPGDSGSSVIDAAGHAVGVLVRLSPVDTAAIEATDLAFHVARATTHTGITFTLQTAPLAP